MTQFLSQLANIETRKPVPSSPQTCLCDACSQSARHSRARGVGLVNDVTLRRRLLIKGFYSSTAGQCKSKKRSISSTACIACCHPHAGLTTGNRSLESTVRYANVGLETTRW